MELHADSFGRYCQHVWRKSLLVKDSDTDESIVDRSSVDRYKNQIEEIRLHVISSKLESGFVSEHAHAQLGHENMPRTICLTV